MFSGCITVAVETDAEEHIAQIPETAEKPEAPSQDDKPKEPLLPKLELTVTKIILEENITEEINREIEEYFLHPSPQFDTPKQFPETTTPSYKISREIYSNGIKKEKSLMAFFTAHCPHQNRFRARRITRLYIEECAAEGINSDIAFVQMCHETNFLRFGNLVKKEWNNFCGLGAINAEQPGLKFKTMRDGVRAHVQHLHAYATTEDITLKNELIDPRYKYVRPRGKATTIEGLAGTWAADRAYSEKLEKYLCELEGL